MALALPAGRSVQRVPKAWQGQVGQVTSRRPGAADDRDGTSGVITDPHDRQQYRHWHPPPPS